MQVRLENVTKKLPGVTAVNTFSVTLPDGELICLLGPSGCGESTILNMLSGILPVSGGSIYFDEDNVTKLPPEERGIGLVFQNYALYPHMTVLENICFPLEIKRVPKDERVARATENGKAGARGYAAQPQAQGAVRRPAAACGHRPRAGQGAAPAAAG